MIQKGHILIVDDERINRFLLARNVNQAGYSCTEVASGEGALLILEQQPFDAILLDLIMPAMDGYEVLKYVKQNKNTQHIPVIIVSNLNHISSLIECVELGATDYLLKPANLQLLKARLDACMSQKHWREAEMAYMAELEKQNAELDAFAHTVAHDLKTPLTGILGYSQLLTRMNNSELLDKRHYLNKIYNAGQRMTSIINELLLLASIRKETVECTPLDMTHILETVYHRFDFMFQTYRPELILPAQWPTAVGYAPWVEEAWANYVSNALKYGGTPPRLEFGSEVSPTQNYVRFWVKDNGVGLQPEQMAKLFRPFSRLGQTQAEGQGLGLSIVQRIMAKLNGEVGVESEVGRGSTFWFALPHHLPKQ